MRDRELLFEKIKDLNADCLFVLDSSTRYWLTGFRSSDGVVVVSKDEISLFLDGRYTEKAYSQKPYAKIYPVKSGLFKESCEYILKKGFKSVLVDSQNILLSDFKILGEYLEGINLVNEKNILTEFISVKDENEISFIKEAVRITDECFLNVLNFIKKGITETEIATEINYYFLKNGCEFAFDTIVVSGVKSSMPHGTPEMVPITENSFITMDFGAKYKGYCSDLTRTVVFGEADEEMKNIYDIVLNANLSGIKASICGNTFGDVDNASRGYIKAKGYAEYFTHSTGHSLGIDIHEKPNAAPSSKSIITNGNVFTVEPGIYIPNKYGVRIEDTVLISNNKAEILSQSPKDLIEIKI